jgi:predicted Zn finger-like uncharacterized protein
MHTMSEKLFRFLLSELETVRVKCLQCQTVFEVRTDQIAATFPESKCPVCRKMLGAIPSVSGFTHLSEAIRQFKADAASVQIEFTIPEKD